MITVLLFAGARDTVGSNHIRLDWPEAGNVEQLRATLDLQYPAINRLLKPALFARGRAYLSQDAIIQPGDEIAMIPSVSGG